MPIVNHGKLWAQIGTIKLKLSAKLIPHPLNFFKLLHEKSYEQIWAEIQIWEKIGVRQNMAALESLKNIKTRFETYVQLKSQAWVKSPTCFKPNFFPKKLSK